jgi:subtilisin
MNSEQIPVAAPAPPWRVDRTAHVGVPAWGVPRSAIPAIEIDPMPADVTWNWAFGGANGSGVRVCVLDSGVDAGHPRVGRIDASMAVTVGQAEEPRVVVTEAVDPAGHGTACAGVIRELAPGCELASVRVLDSGISGGGAALIAGLRWAIDEGYDVVNLSLSTARLAFRAELADLCDTAYYRRTVICASANNAPVISFPWRFAAVVSVASTDRSGDRTGSGEASHYYNIVPPAEFLAPGVGIEVAWSGKTVIRATGNSFATPYVSGLCALLLSKHPDLTPFQVKTALFMSAANVGGTDVH